MTFDLYADLASQPPPQTGGSLPARLASGFVDGCTSLSARGGDQRNEARRQYLQQASSAPMALPAALSLEPRLGSLPDRLWIAFELEFTLLTPWYAKDDRPFHVLDNPLRKDRVFGVPYMAAASWKGLLRWACRMQSGLLEYLANHGGKLDGWQDPGWIVHLFGNEKGETEDFQRGALAFYPTWFSQIGYEVINPHKRETRAGTQPIYYEVVPVGTPGTLRLLSAPLPGSSPVGTVEPVDAIGRLLDACETLLTAYGISAKRTAGWGTARVDRWAAQRNDQTPIRQASLADFKQCLLPWLQAKDARDG